MKIVLIILSVTIPLWAIVWSFLMRLTFGGLDGEIRLLSWKEWRALRKQGLGSPFWPWQWFK